MEKIAAHYMDNVRWFDQVLGVGRSCDVVSRDFYVGGRRSRIWVIDGYGRDAILERMGAFWLSLPEEAIKPLTQMQDFADRFITFSETSVTFDRQEIVTSVLMGKTLLVMEGMQGAALMDAKDYPGRSVGEPPDGKVLRGSHDGFIEAVVPNMALLAPAHPGPASDHGEPQGRHPLPHGRGAVLSGGQGGPGAFAGGPLQTGIHRCALPVHGAGKRGGGHAAKAVV